MTALLMVLVAAVLFVGTHLGLATGRLRAALVATLGNRGFLAGYSAIAALTFALLVGAYATVRLDGPAGVGLAAVPIARTALMALVVAGFMLMVPGLVTYDRAPSALFTRRISEPRGVHRITRHPFFMGLALVMAAHTLLATRAVGAVFCGALTVLAVAGARLQDRKLLARHGEPYAAFLAATSTIPGAALLDGRQTLHLRELPLAGMLAGLAVALALRSAHDAIFAAGGAYVIGSVLGGAALATWSAARRARRAGSAEAALGRQQEGVARPRTDGMRR